MSLEVFESFLNGPTRIIVKCRSTDKHYLVPRLWVLDMLCVKLRVVQVTGVALKYEAVELRVGMHGYYIPDKFCKDLRGRGLTRYKTTN